MKLICIAGPYRADNECEVVQNIRRAEALAVALWKLGIAVICPHKNTAHLGGTVPDQMWLLGAQEMVRRSDAVVCLPEWEHSEGALLEVQVAREEGLPVFFAMNEVVSWLISQE